MIKEFFLKQALKFGAKDSNDFMTHRWTLVRNGSGDLVAIGVTIPNGDSEKKLSKDFQHMIARQLTFETDLEP